MPIFLSLAYVILCQFYSITSPVLFTKNNKLWNKAKGNFSACMASSEYHVLSKEVQNRIFKHNFIFRYTWIYKQSILTKQWNYFFVCKYYIVISDTLIGARMCFSVQSNFIEIALRHGWSPVNLPHIFRIHFPKSSFGRLFLLLLSVILLELQDKPSRKD